MKVAVVGSGAAGLAATWALNEHSDHTVHLYESDCRVGGHANTVKYTCGEQQVDVDTGFIVFNPSTYPNFLRFLRRYPSIKILPTEMTFSVSRDGGLFEWAGNNIATFFCQPSRLLDPQMWRLLYDILRFNACARRLVMSSWAETSDNCSIGEYLEREGYSNAFRDNYLIPMTACIWSTPTDVCSMDFPAKTLIQFMNNHHLMQLTGKPAWLTLEGGSRVYVERILKTLPSDCVRLNCPVTSIFNDSGSDKPSGVLLKTADGQSTLYDHVILACHSDTALSILEAGGDIREKERSILNAFRWNRNECVLHSDTKLMPARRAAWSCWNFLARSSLDGEGRPRPNADEVALTYSMNLLQHIPESRFGPVLVTLNPPFKPAPEKLVGYYQYDHPVLDAQAIRAQEELKSIQATRGISFAGAWMRYGFHEDGFTTGLRAAAEHLPGVKLPFPIEDAEREPASALVAHAFDLLEQTGARYIIGMFVSFWFALFRGLLGIIVDLQVLPYERGTSKTAR